MRQSSYFNTLPVSILPGRTARFDVTGRFLYVLEATDSFRLRVDDSEEIPAQAGLQYEVGAEEMFTQLTFRNPSVNTLQAILLTGMGEFRDARINVQPDRANQFIPFVPAPSVIVPSNTTSLAHNAALALNGLENRALGLGQRLAIWVTNLHATSALELYEVSLSLNILKVFALTAVRIPIGPQAVEIRNTSGVSVNLFAAEEYARWTAPF